MVQRNVKRNIKKTFFGIGLVAFIISIIVLLGLSIKNALPLLKIGENNKSQIIKPVSELATKDEVAKILSSKNIIMESLVEGSSSGVIIGQIKEGPKVYFSNNKDARWQVTSLELILNKLTIDNKKPNLIDLRFEQPIVKF